MNLKPGDLIRSLCLKDKSLTVQSGPHQVAGRPVYVVASEPPDLKTYIVEEKNILYIPVAEKTAPKVVQETLAKPGDRVRVLQCCVENDTRHTGQIGKFSRMTEEGLFEVFLDNRIFKMPCEAVRIELVERAEPKLGDQVRVVACINERGDHIGLTGELTEITTYGPLVVTLESDLSDHCVAMKVEPV
jgi:hypothetical protein